jgi:hypothetical protein
MRLSTELVAGETQHLGAPGFVLPERGDDQHLRGANPPGHERQESQAHVVGPVQILEPEQDRLRRPEPLHHVAHALEQAQAVARWRGPAVLRNLGEQKGQRGAPRRIQLAQQGLVADDAPRAQGIRPGAERQDLFALVAPAQQHSAPVLYRLRRHFSQQSTLADARLADDHHDLPLPLPYSRPRLPQPRHLHLASYQPALGRRCVRRRGGGAVESPPPR